MLAGGAGIGDPPGVGPGYTRRCRRAGDGRTHGRTETPLDSAELAQRIADVLSDRQAGDIVLMDIGKVSSFTDHFVIATADNPRQMNALVDSLDRDLRDEDVRPRRIEGAPDSGWVLVDFGDVIAHLFAPAERAYYDLESLWAKGVSVVHMQ